MFMKTRKVTFLDRYNVPLLDGEKNEEMLMNK